ncbi:hypothetical protein TSMEX_000977 [Taenia solium]|eukprot:TsM_000536000 transcript=TsM_000536000 gene=TsM_000536000
MRVYRQSYVCLAALLLILLASPNIQQASADERFEKFKACIQSCSDLNAKCNERVQDLWIDFFKNKKAILRHLRKCCLRGETREDSNPEDSFAACTRIRCGAKLWGCQIQKKHSGFLSEEEKEHLKQGHHD